MSWLFSAVKVGTSMMGYIAHVTLGYVVPAYHMKFNFSFLVQRKMDPEFLLQAEGS